MRIPWPCIVTAYWRWSLQTCRQFPCFWLVCAVLDQRRPSIRLAVIITKLSREGSHTSRLRRSISPLSPPPDRLKQYECSGFAPVSGSFASLKLARLIRLKDAPAVSNRELFEKLSAGDFVQAFRSSGFHLASIFISHSQSPGKR